MVKSTSNRSQSPRGLRHKSAAARLLRLWVRIPPGACISVSCECCVFGRYLSDELIACPAEFYPTVVCSCVWCRNLNNPEAITRVGVQRYREKIHEKGVGGVVTFRVGFIRIYIHLNTHTHTHTYIRTHAYTNTYGYIYRFLQLRKILLFYKITQN
jgi:hypothetical protein